jgi:hypothetical protein
MDVTTKGAGGTIRAVLSGHYRDGASYPAAMVNVTSRCNLECAHCFVYCQGNPNEAPASVHDEMADAAILETLAGLRDRHGVYLDVNATGERCGAGTDQERASWWSSVMTSAMMGYDFRCTRSTDVGMSA